MELTAEEVGFEGDGGAALRATFTGPAGDDELPALLLLHEVFGADVHMHEVARRLAGEGFRVLLPDLYSRDGLPGPASSEADPAPRWEREAIRAAVASLPDRRTLRDLEAALAWLGARDDVLDEEPGVVGFCMGGTLAFLLGCTSTSVGAVVDFYGRPLYPELSPEKPTQPLELTLNLDRPFLGFFGEADEGIPTEHVELLRQKLASGAKNFELVTYPGCAHGFFNDRRSNHDPAAAEDAWRRTIAFLHEVLTPDFP